MPKKFQSTLPRGERQKRSFMAIRSGRFQSTLPRGERQSRTKSIWSGYLFQSTLPRGERLQCFIDFLRIHYISIHAPARGATILDGLSPVFCLISIHAPARGATSAVAIPFAVNMISIHAPARGATGAFHQPGKPLEISIHAPARGATSYDSDGLGVMYFNPRSREGSDAVHCHKRRPADDFNPRSREGSDHKSCNSCAISFTISIHAPARGATRIRSALGAIIDYFNPRSREGSDR